MVKKVFVEQIQEEVFVVYLKNWDVKVGKGSSELLGHSSIEKLTMDYYFLSNSKGKKEASIPETDFEVFRKVKTQAFAEFGDVVQLAQCIFVVYSSCQG